MNSKSVLRRCQISTKFQNVPSHGSAGKTRNLKNWCQRLTPYTSLWIMYHKLWGKTDAILTLWIFAQYLRSCRAYHNEAWSKFSFNISWYKIWRWLWLNFDNYLHCLGVSHQDMLTYGKLFANSRAPPSREPLALGNFNGNRLSQSSVVVKRLENNYDEKKQWRYL